MTAVAASGVVRLCAAGFAAYCSYAICRTPLLPLFARDLGAGPSLIGFVMGASTLTGIVLKLPAGAWSDLLGRRPLLVSGALVFATLPFTYLGVSTLAALVLLRFVHGSATAIFGPVASASLSDIAPPSKRGAWLSTYSTAQGAGQALGPVLAGYLIAAGRFDLAFLAAGVIGLAAPVIVAGWQSGSTAPPGRARWQDFKAGVGEVARNRLVLVTSGAQAAQFVLNGALNAFLPLYGRDVIGLTTPELGWLFGVQTATTLAIRPLIGFLSDRAGRRWVIVAGLTVCSAAVLAMSGVSGLRPLVGAVVAYAAGVATTTAATSAYITDVTPRARYGAAHGVFGTIYDVGDALGPIAAGLLVATVGYARMFQVMALVGVTMAAVFLLTSRSRLPVRALVVATLLLGWPEGASAQFMLRATRAQTPPVIDGVLADGEWHGAPVATGFVQFEPRRGERSPFRTEALVLYDRQHIYVAFRAWDPEPLTAQLTQRDAELDRDDAVGVLIDTFGDRQTAYFFAVNVLGTQADARIADDGRTADFNWDAPWRAAARRTPDGWTAEMSLPLASMKYAAGENRTWGINFARSRRRTLELSHWAGPLEHPYRVSQFGGLTGLTLAAPERRQQVIPYALSRVQESEHPDWDLGIDARYALTPQLSLYGTLFPDFATVEADQETINLTRFEVQLREKRQFFLEGNELFGQRIRSFYSRRIAEIAGGAKLLGKQGPWTLAALSVQSEPLALDERANYTVGRAQRAVFGRSAVAVMGASRRLADLNEGSIGLDTNLLFGRTFNFTGQWLASYGRYSHGTIAWFVRPSYDSPTGHFHVRYTHLGDRVADNVNAIGQVRDDDRRELDSAVNKTLWFRGSAVERVRYDSNYNAYWAQKTGTLRSWQIDEGLAVDLRNRVSAEMDYTEEYKLFEKGFRNRQVAFALGYNTREYQSVSAGYEFGRNFDADYALWRGSARRKLGDATAVEYELQRVRFTPDPDRRSTLIHVLRGSYFLTPDLFVRVFFQSNSAIDRRNVQATFVYRYVPPFGTLQMVYQRGTAEFGQRSDQGHTLFVKATTVF